MFTHVMVGSNAPEKARNFYRAVLGALGYEAHEMGNHTFFTDGHAHFIVGPPRDGEAACHANGGTIGFQAKSTDAIHAFHAAGVANGGACEGAPGSRPNSPGQPYAAYLRDPDGNKIGAFTPDPNN
jgi:catechol 2,3-dioxygenase-like lactoylglutathione lyase family enzyme